MSPGPFAAAGARERSPVVLRGAAKVEGSSPSRGEKDRVRFSESPPQRARYNPASPANSLHPGDDIRHWEELPSDGEGRGRGSHRPHPKRRPGPPWKGKASGKGKSGGSGAKGGGKGSEPKPGTPGFFVKMRQAAKAKREAARGGGRGASA